jgi:hypothetical protein
MFLKLSFVYIILVFLAGVGVLQAAAAFNDLNGLLFFPKKMFSYFFALVMTGLPLAVLFDWNWHYAIGIIQGAEQTELFFLTMVLALFFTLLVSSIINVRRFSEPNDNLEGLDSLRKSTYFQMLKSHFRKKN